MRLLEKFRIALRLVMQNWRNSATRNVMIAYGLWVKLPSHADEMAFIRTDPEYGVSIGVQIGEVDDFVRRMSDAARTSVMGQSFQIGGYSCSIKPINECLRVTFTWAVVTGSNITLRS